MKILLFNWHEPYIEIFARTNDEYFVAPPVANQNKQWHHNFRPLPSNCTEVSFGEISDLDIDLVVCMSLKDREALRYFRITVPAVFVELNMPSENFGTVGFKPAHIRTLNNIRASGVFEHLSLAVISEKKRADWGALGQNAPVVVSGVDTDYFHGFVGNRATVLRVGNGMPQRDAMQGFSIGNDIVKDMSSILVGEDNGTTLPSVIGPAPNVYGLRHCYRHHRVMLSCLSDDREDGYNLAMLEAMSTGMPIVAWENSSLPACQGVIEVNTIKSAQSAIKMLLSDPAMAFDLGKTCREHAIKHFNISRCAKQWSEVFRSVANQ